MTGPYEVYIRDAHGVLTKVTGRLAAEVMADFWETWKQEHPHEDDPTTEEPA